MIKLLLAAVIQVGNMTLMTTEHEYSVSNEVPNQVYRLERNPNTEQVWLVGQDYQKRECVVLGVDEYAMLTGRLDQVWKSFNKTEDGRMKLHGKRNRTYIEGVDKFTVYDDGFVHRERAVVKSTNTVNRVRMQGVHEQPKRPSFDRTRFSERHAKMKEAIERQKSGAIKTVTVVHDAATGKDTEVK